MKQDRSFFVCLGIILIALTIRIFVYGLYQIPSSSMESTLLIGDMLIGNKWLLLHSLPKRYDIIVFNDPEYNYSSHPITRLFEQYMMGPRNFTKRIIGLPGDHILGTIEHQKPVIYCNGNLLQEAYVNYNQGDMHDEMRVSNTAVDYWDGSDIFNVILKADQYWVMGDNRDNSYDSRIYGPIDRARIRAQICFRLFSADTTFSWRDIFYAPWKLLQCIRWQRCGTFIPSYHTTVKEQ